MTPDQYRAQNLADLERRWESGEFTALDDAIVFCQVSQAPLPLWLAEAVRGELHAQFHGLGPKERGFKQGWKARLKSLAVDKRRASWAAFYLRARNKESMDARSPRNRAEAFELASRRLAGTFAQGSAAEVEKAYNRHLRRTQRNS